MKQWASNNFNKGLNTKDNPAMLGLNELSEATNVVVEDGKIKFREGYSDKSSIAGYVSANSIHGLIEYNDTTTPANNKMIYALGTDLKTGSTVLDNDINATNYVNFSKFTNNEKLYYIDGEHAVKSLFGSYEKYNDTACGLPDTNIPFIFTKNNITFAVTTTDTYRVELWKLTGSTWALDKYLSANSAPYYWHSFCYDGTYYYAILSDGSLHKFDDIGTSYSTKTIDNSPTFVYTHNKKNKSVYSTYDSHIYNFTYGSYTFGASNNASMIKISPSTGYVASFDVGASISIPSLCLYGSNLYFTINTGIYWILNLNSSFVFGSCNLFNLAIDETGSIVKLSSGFAICGNDRIYYFDNNFNMIEKWIGNTIDFICNSSDGTIEDVYFSAYGVWILNKKYTLAITNNVYNVSDTYTNLIKITAGVGTEFREGTWYFAYQLMIFNSITGEYRPTPISDTFTYTIATSTTNSITLNVVGLVLPLNSFINYYARHETENYFYKIGSGDSTTFTSYSDMYFNLSAVYDETLVYTPAPIGTTQIMSYRDMMVYVKDNSLYFSNYFDPINCPTTIATDTASGLGGYYPIGKENNAITGIYQLHGYLFVFKSHYTYLISGDPGELATFRIDLISDKVGAKNERCITDDGSFIYVYCDTGIYPINENGIGKSLTEYVEKDVLANYATSGYDHALCYHQKLNRLMLLERP